MKRIILSIICGTLALTTTAFEKSESKPYVRWWWLGSAVDSVGIDYNLSEFARQGIGGVEITPIYGVKGNESNDRPFLSKEWFNLYSYTVNRANELGLQVDMSNCTGWPFGGPWVSIEDAASKYILDSYTIEPNQLFELELLPKDPKQHAVAKLQAIQAENIKTKEKRSLLKYVKNGTLSWKAPKGEWKVYTLYSGRTFQKVKRAAPGGEGYVLNHYDSLAVQRYLDHFAHAFETNNAPYPDSFFNDSYEVYGASWTDDFLNQFRKDHQYNLEDYLPEFAREGKDAASMRIVNDYRTTIEGLLMNNFTKVWHKWANSKGSRVRNQAHGSPANLFDLYAEVDIAECESFGHTNFGIKGMHPNPDAKENDSDPAVFKLASSATNVTGKNITSAESLTWLTEHFHTSLALCKPEIDNFFISGINHLYFHGAPYSPKNVSFPGWLFYASINMSPTAPLWEDASGLFNYIERCQSMLQQATPDNDFLLYIPIDDIRNTNAGRNYLLFDIHKMDRTMPYLKEVMNKIINIGYDADYISDAYLTSLHVDNGELVTVGGTRYKALILPNCQQIPLSTLQKIVSLAEQGAKIVLFEGIPNDVSGFKYYQSELKQAQTLFKGLSTRKYLRGNNLQELLKQAGGSYEPIKNQGTRLIRKNTRIGKLYFISQLSDSDIDGWVEIGVATDNVAFLDPITGNRAKAAIRKNGDKKEVYLQLRSGESIIVYDTKERLDQWPYLGIRDKGITSNNWSLSFQDSYPVIEETYILDKPCDWTKLSDDLKINCGTGTYSTVFTIPDTSITDEWILDLGDVRASARVKINGKEVSTSWSVPFELRVGQWLQNGNNQIEISVTNIPANRMAQMDRDKDDWRIFKDANIVSSKYKQLSCEKWDIAPAGLLNDVVLYPVNIKQLNNK